MILTGELKNIVNDFILEEIQAMIKPTVIIVTLTLGVGQCPGSSFEMSMGAVFASITFLDKITKATSELPDILSHLSLSKRAFTRI